MRRNFLLLSLIAAAVGFQACAADSPAPTPPGGSGSSANTALQVRLFTNNANPTVGLCATIQAIVTLNGANVADGTGVIFSTDLGTFQQNGQAVVSVVTQNGTALTAVCSDVVGVAKVKASATVGKSTASSSINISFQPSSQAVPFFAFCSPNSGPNTGGTVLTISGGRFFGDATSTRVQFTVFGITREGVVQAVTATTLTVLTPAFPEAMSPSVPVDITVTFGTNTGTPITLAVPNCFVYGTASGNQPTITAVLPSTGSNDGGTRVTILGSGFLAPIQVFFGSVEAAPPISVTFNQIIVLAPAASGPGLANLNQTVGIRVRNTISGNENTLAAAFTFVTKLQITAISNNAQRIDQLSALTIFGQGFSSPMAVSLAGIGAFISSVSSTELVVVPGIPLLAGCADLSGAVHVVNVANGDFADGPSFTYLVAQTAPIINSVLPSAGFFSSGVTLTITGANFPTSAVDVLVKVGTRLAAVVSTSPNTIVVLLPDNNNATFPPCGAGQSPGDPVVVETDDVTVTNRRTTCTATSPGAFSYTRPCS